MYYLWSARSQAWFTRAATYSTDLEQAWPLTWEEARGIARKHKTDGQRLLLPVRADDLEAI